MLQLTLSLNLICKSVKDILIHIFKNVFNNGRLARAASTIDRDKGHDMAFFVSKQKPCKLFGFVLPSNYPRRRPESVKVGFVCKHTILAFQLGSDSFEVLSVHCGLQTGSTGNAYININQNATAPLIKI